MEEWWEEEMKGGLQGGKKGEMRKCSTGGRKPQDLDKDWLNWLIPTVTNVMEG